MNPARDFGNKFCRIFVLSFIVALELHVAHNKLKASAEAEELQHLEGVIGTALPDDCAIVASEVAARLKRTGAWTRILNILYSERGPFGLMGQRHRHDLVVWQPPTARKINIYDQTILKGTSELDTAEHDAIAIARVFAAKHGLIIFEATFLQ